MSNTLTCIDDYDNLYDWDELQDALSARNASRLEFAVANSGRQALRAMGDLREHFEGQSNDVSKHKDHAYHTIHDFLSDDLYNDPKAGINRYDLQIPNLLGHTTLAEDFIVNRQGKVTDAENERFMRNIYETTANLLAKRMIEHITYTSEKVNELRAQHQSQLAAEDNQAFDTCIAVLDQEKQTITQALSAQRRR